MFMDRNARPAKLFAVVAKSRGGDALFRLGRVSKSGRTRDMNKYLSTYKRQRTRVGSLLPGFPIREKAYDRVFCVNRLNTNDIREP